MGIMTRCMRIWKADVNGVMDQLEDRGLLLKQSLRDMEDELGRKEHDLKRMRMRMEQAQQECGRYDDEIDKLEQDLEVAVAKEKDDISRMLIKKLILFRKYRGALDSRRQALDGEISRQQELIAEQRLQYEEIAIKSGEFFHRAERRDQGDFFYGGKPGSPFDVCGEPSAEEIELELLKRKEAEKKASKGDEK